MREEQIVLEDVADAALFGRQVDVVRRGKEWRIVDGDLARVGLEQTGDRVE